MFVRSNTQVGLGAGDRVVAKRRLGHMLAALMAVAVACAALVASPAMASTESPDSRANPTQLCMQPTYDTKAEPAQGGFEAAFKFCASADDPKSTTTDDPKGEAAIGLRGQAAAVVIICEFGGSAEYAGVCLLHDGPYWVECMLHNNGTITCTSWNDGSGHRLAAAPESDEAEAISAR